jgi:carbamoyltransferase
LIILGIHTGGHDGTAAVFNDYGLLSAVQLERLTRKKGDGKGVPEPAIDEALDIVGLRRRDVDVIVTSRALFHARHYRMPPYRRFEDWINRCLGRGKMKVMESELYRRQVADAASIFRREAFLADYRFRPDTQVRFSNHHFAHALSALFFTDWDDALLYTADGGGDNVHYSMRSLSDGRLTDLYGDDRCLLTPRRVDSLGLAYGFTTQALGYRMNRHEGKLTGLAAYGEPTLLDDLAGHFEIDDSGEVISDFASDLAMRAEIFRLAEGQPPENVAASIQQLLEDTLFASVSRFLDRTKACTLALAGGVFANVRLNRLLCEQTGVDEVFIFPGMGDEGLAVGGALQFLLERDGLETWLGHRCRLDSVYLGRDYTGHIDTVLGSAPGVRRIDGPPHETAAALLAGGAIGAIYETRMEYGPRALGARSILASPAQRDVNQSLNDRLERTEFMPFAPYVLDEDAETVFGVTGANRYACRFMTITTDVKPEWRERIPAVVHVDGTARPQIIDRATNPLYADILADFRTRTGLPVLVNTSFNAHEEPIINTPEECLRALADDRVDFIVTRQGVYAAKDLDMGAD